MEARQYIPHYTVEDYERWEGDWELWRGVPVSMSPSPSRWHQAVLRNLLTHIQQQLVAFDECGCEALPEIDWRIDDDTVVRPDIAVDCEPGQGQEPFLTRAPSLIVEVLSPSNAHKDRTAKRDLYAEQGVGYYLMADPETQTLEVLELAGEAYHAIAADAPLTLHPGCELTIDPASIWA